MTNYSQAVPLIALDELSDNCSISVNREQINFLIINQGGQLFVIEDRCGHFGISLKEGKIENGEIRCPAHGAKFDLETGDLKNDLFEECDPITVFLWRKNNGWLEVLL